MMARVDPVKFRTYDELIDYIWLVIDEFAERYDYEEFIPILVDIENEELFPLGQLSVVFSTIFDFSDEKGMLTDTIDVFIHGVPIDSNTRKSKKYHFGEVPI